MNKVDKILKEIEERNINRHGQKQECCGMYEDYCRCYVSGYLREKREKDLGGGLPIEVLEELREKNKK